MVSELDGVSEVGILSLSFPCASNIFNFKIHIWFKIFLGVHDVGKVIRGCKILAPDIP